MRAVVRAVGIPVSIKTRLGWDDAHRDWRDLIAIAADCGIRFAALHGRTRAQLYNGPADLPEKCDTPIPVIANGDIRTESDIVRVQNLGYDGAMIGRGMLGRPWLLGELSGVCTAPKNIGDIVLRHLDYMLEYYGEKNAVPMFRKHAAWYSVGLANSAEFRIRVNQINSVADLQAEICKFWGCAAAI